MISRLSIIQFAHAQCVYFIAIPIQQLKRQLVGKNGIMSHINTWKGANCISLFGIKCLLSFKYKYLVLKIEIGISTVLEKSYRVVR